MSVKTILVGLALVSALAGSACGDGGSPVGPTPVRYGFPEMQAQSTVPMLDRTIDGR